MPSIIACDHASISSKRILVRPVMSFRHSADSGSANALQRSVPPVGASSSRMRSAWAANALLQVSRTVRGETDGNIAARSDMCASPSLRIMLWPISVYQAGRLMRREYVGAFLLAEDVVAPCE